MNMKRSEFVLGALSVAFVGCTKDGSNDIKKGENLYAFSGSIDGGLHTVEGLTARICVICLHHCGELEV